MTPPEVAALDDEDHDAMVRLMLREAAEIERINKRRR
jgi:hypothetical protein